MITHPKSAVAFSPGGGVAILRGAATHLQDFVYISADDSWRFCITTRIRLLVDIIPHSNSFLITDFLDTHNYT